jgi:hypothetical protein
MMIVMGLFGDDFMAKIIMSWVPNSTEQLAQGFGNTFRWTFLFVYAVASFMTLTPVLRTIWWLDSEKVNQDYNLVRRTSYPMLYNHISGVSLWQSGLGKIFGYGTITIQRQGMDPYYIRNAPHAEEVFGFLLEVASLNGAQHADN